MIKYYQDYISPEVYKKLIQPGLQEISPDLFSLAAARGLETEEALVFLKELYCELRGDLAEVLENRIKDRRFIDERCKTLYQYNQDNQVDLHDQSYQTVIGLKDENDRTVIGPISDYKVANNNSVAAIPDYLDGIHVTLFGPPGKAKMSINAMNAFHRKLKSEPAVVSELLAETKIFPKWGADDEDSKTPLHADLTEASFNLSQCFDQTIEVKDGAKHYQLAADHLSLPIKRFPGLALPSPFMFYQHEPIPMHLYDFALHFFHHFDNPQALTFYVPKLENEEEALYIKKMFECAEKKIQAKNPEYKMGTIRCIIVLENPRAVFRVNEMMDNLFPYFVGASLGWHDYLGSTARLLKEDGNYRIPVKADPDIVIKYIKASHELLSDVVGERGGIKIGGMYGILPLDNDLQSNSFQMTMRGYIRDVITQMKRNLSGFWVAHPDFVRIGIALVEAWKRYDAGEKSYLKQIVNALLKEDYAQEVWAFIEGQDIEGLDKDHHRYDRSLIVADIKESSFIANNHPDEIRYNVFQSLQYLTDWLSGNGCVALPAMVDGVSVRVMDDLATAERSRWEVWHEIYHQRFSIEELIQIAHEEMLFIRKDLSHEKKIVQVKYNQANAKWYDAAFKIMLKLMTDSSPAEFATELLMPFTLQKVRESAHPWDLLAATHPEKFCLSPGVERFNYYFENCGCKNFASKMAQFPLYDPANAQDIILAFTEDEINEAAYFHGNIGENSNLLDEKAAKEQAGVEAQLQQTLLELGSEYRKKFGFKFLVSAKGKSGREMLQILEQRMENSKQDELENARNALWAITNKRMQPDLKKKLNELFVASKAKGLQLAISTGEAIQTLCFGDEVRSDSKLQIASLSKTIGSAFALEIFPAYGIELDDFVNDVIARFKGNFKLEQDVRIRDLMQHTALNMHYVNGVVDASRIEDFLEQKYGYEKIRILSQPGERFSYSGAGFIVLEYILKLVLKEDPRHAITNWLADIDINLDQSTPHLTGYRDSGEAVSLQFPAIAAGAVGSAAGMVKFLQRISQHKEMLYGLDRGAQKFMGANIGLGTFIAEAGQNRFMLHQGANDGYRALYLYCVKGPNQGFAMSLLAQGELSCVLLISQMVQILLEAFQIEGVDFSQFKTQFDAQDLKPEEIVNRGYKDLVFSAFKPDLPAAINYQRLKHPLWREDLLQNANISYVSSQKFARAENLISPFEPFFDPSDFGHQGKVMDSWETPRHNPDSFDELHLKLDHTAQIKNIEISTKYHLGNQVEAIEILNEQDEKILPKTAIQGHALLIKNVLSEAHLIKVRVYPDGGLTRLRMFGFERDEKNEVFDEKIPLPLKPMTLEFKHLPESHKKMNLADYTLGARIISASDEHYAPAISILSPFAPLNMFDGFESARSRVKDHFEQVEIKLCRKSHIAQVVFDFSYFVNNNPCWISLEGFNGQEWLTLKEKIWTKPYAGASQVISIESELEFEHLRIRLFPDGGFNRIKVFSCSEQ